MFQDFEVPKELYLSDPRLACGPSKVPQSFLDSLAKDGSKLLGTSHRKPAVKNLLKEVQEGLLDYFQAPDGYEVVLGNGGATFLFDAIGLGMVEKKAAHFTCGEFSTKWAKSDKLIPWIETEEIAVEYGQGITPKDVEGADFICTTLNETSTGVMVDTFEHVKNSNAIVSVDATSGGGQCPCNLADIDMFFFSPQKVFASEGGTYVAIMSPKAIERALKVCADKSRYIPPIMDFTAAIENSRKNQTYTTPSITTFYLLNEQLKEMRKMGYQGVQDDGHKKAKLIYDWAENKEYLKPYVSDAKYRSNAVATIDLDEKFDASALIKRLADLGVARDIDSYRKLGRNQFRIALFQAIEYGDLEKLTKIISMAVESKL